jgi:hypothetical protein
MAPVDDRSTPQHAWRAPGSSAIRHNKAPWNSMEQLGDEEPGVWVARIAVIRAREPPAVAAAAWEWYVAAADLQVANECGAINIGASNPPLALLNPISAINIGASNPISASNIAVEIDKAEAEVEMAEAKFDKANAEVEKAKAEQNLRAAKAAADLQVANVCGAIAMEIDKAGAKVEKANADVKKAEAKIEKAEAKVKEANAEQNLSAAEARAAASRTASRQPNSTATQQHEAQCDLFAVRVCEAELHLASAVARGDANLAPFVKGVTQARDAERKITQSEGVPSDCRPVTEADLAEMLHASPDDDQDTRWAQAQQLKAWYYATQGFEYSATGPTDATTSERSLGGEAQPPLLERVESYLATMSNP